MLATKIKGEYYLFLLAISFFTRIPLPIPLQTKEVRTSQALFYYPVVGLIVGGISAITFILSNILLSHNLSVIISMAIAVWITGGIHEDGLADSCDGFCGGYEQTKVLEIMKDSSIGTFGVLGLGITLSIKAFTLFEMNQQMIPVAIISAHSISRMISSFIMWSHPYVRDKEHSKSLLFTERLSRERLIISMFIGLLPLIFFCHIRILLVLLPLISLKVFIGAYLKKRIGGYTGDTIGMTQQLSELIFYLSVIIIWKSF